AALSSESTPIGLADPKTERSGCLRSTSEVSLSVTLLAQGKLFWCWELERVVYRGVGRPFLMEPHAHPSNRDHGNTRRPNRCTSPILSARNKPIAQRLADRTGAFPS